jgi:hypothetical protein
LDLGLETFALGKVKDQLQAASSESDNVILTGDVNLDMSRHLDMRYRRRCLMLAHDTVIAAADMRYLETGITYRSQGLHVQDDSEGREHKSRSSTSCVCPRSW